MTAYRIYRRQPTGPLDWLIGTRLLVIAPDDTPIGTADTRRGAHRLIRRHRARQAEAATLRHGARLVDQVPA